MPKEPKVKQSRKNLLMLVAALAIVVPTGSYAAYKYITPTAVQSTYFNKTTTLAGDGTHQARIELTLLNGLNEPMSNINITPQASVGNVSSCTTTAGGTCFIVYTPPRTANNENATIFISIGNFHQNMQFAITPDQITQIGLSSNVTEIYTNSSAKVTATLKDAFGNLIPDGAQVNFSLQGTGSLSATSCLTFNGQCSVSYTSSPNAGTATIYANASTLSKQISIGFVPHELQVSLSANTTQVYTNGTAKLNVTVRDAFGKLVANGTQVNFSVQNGGHFSSVSCITTKGQCSINYMAPPSVGSATIEAAAGNFSGYINIGIESRFKAIQKQILSIGNSAAYCSGSWPYYGINLSVYSGENVTWSVGSISLDLYGSGPVQYDPYGAPWTYRLYLFNGSQYASFSSSVSNATSQFQQAETTCSQGWDSSNQSNPTTIYCTNAENKYGEYGVFDGDISGVNLYANVLSQINSNNQYGKDVSTESFIVQNTGIYHLVIFMPDYTYATVNGTAMCFSSTAYNTSVENVS